MKYISIDSSTKKSGYAVFENGELINYGLIDCSKEKDSELRINQMGEELLKLLIKEKPDLVTVEHPQGEGRNVMVVNKLSEIIGIIRAYAIQKKKTFVEIMPSEWRRYCGINQGKKKRDELKQMSIDFVKETFGIDANDDTCDAICQGWGYIQFYKEDDYV